MDTPAPECSIQVVRHYSNSLLCLSILLCQCGSAMHVGPEILKKEQYGTKIDCWAMGVVVYTIIGGCPPFYAKNNQAIFQKILKAEYDFEDEEMWGHITVRR